MKKTFYLGLSLVGIWVILALLTPFLHLSDPLAQNLAREFEGPSRTFPLGLGENGVDVLSQLMWASRWSLVVCFLTVMLSAIVGSLLGILSGYLGGWTDLLIMRVVDLVHAFPGILLVIALAAFLGPSLKNMVISLVATSWVSYARLARALSLSLKEREFVLSAHSIGASAWRVMSRHLAPNMLPSLLVLVSQQAGSVLLSESTLSFLGLGVPPGTASWGQMLNQGRDSFLYATHLVIAPSIVMILIILALNLVGDGMRDFLDPKMR